MNSSFLLQQEVQSFIRENQHQEPAALMLQSRRHQSWPMPEVVQQIQGLSKAKSKLPTWHATESILYPAPVSMEQCSSERAALFKAGLLKGDSLLDLTGGFGVDDWAFAKSFRSVTYLERQPELAEIAAHNFKQLGSTNIKVIAADALEWLAISKEQFDVIYLDPARRGDQQQRVLLLQDCEPDVLSLLPILWQHTRQILIKTAPLLDIHQAVTSLQSVSHVWAVAVNGEVKEVLYLLDQKAASAPELHAVDLQTENQLIEFTTTVEREAGAAVNYAAPQRFLYEPNAAVLKIGAFKSIAVRFGLNKLHPSSHLYTSSELVNDFPGRRFEIEQVCRYNTKEVKAALSEGKANITVRNFPETVAQIRKKTGIKEGGHKYLFATTDHQNKHLILVGRKI